MEEEELREAPFPTRTHVQTLQEGKDCLHTVWVLCLQQHRENVPEEVAVVEEEGHWGGEKSSPINLNFGLP